MRYVRPSAHWIDSLRKGDPKTYRELFSLYGKRLYGLARTYQLDHDQAEEIVQETIIIIWERRSYLDKNQNFDAYIRKIGRNQILRALRSLALKVAGDYLNNHDSGAPPEIDSQLTAENIEFFINDAVQKLSPQSRRIYELSREHGYTHAEIAHSLNLSQRTVENQIYRALQKLKSVLNHQELLILVMFLF